MTLLVDPIVGQPHIAKDLVQLFVAQILNNDTTPVFSDGIPDNAAADTGLIYLLPFYLEDKPSCQGVIRVVPKTTRAENPIRTASVTVGLRMPKSVDGNVSAMARVAAAANALTLWLKPNGSVRGETTLPSGRLVRQFKNALDPMVGEDSSKRFLTNVTFDIFYLDINVP